ncbi:MAG: diaminopimelate epimerase [Kordiimonadaceae bacterium]|nr:diaminopimelate epimerase [Kordiimonadaceae bacterium]MBO6567759.1 diaminopimelate epimerase [Kordiimonadaceae bacterium]MBO6963026.1 diaminopimelate epimerase [Kordiimonadaceae bacterium]
MTSEQHTHPFIKMHGLGNDFAIFDARESGLEMFEGRARKLSDRRRGIGCDQLIVLRNSVAADVFMEIWNADGSRVGACGNATRCVGQLILKETGKEKVGIETDAGHLSAVAAHSLISVNMGPASTDWNTIPVAHETDTSSADFECGPLSNPGLVNMGNPHAVFFVDDVASVDLETLGAKIEHDPFFPERVNVSIVQANGRTLRQRVWERGAGITEACGSAACSSVVAATRKGLVDRKATVALDGGELEVEWLADGTVQMTGPATFVFEGQAEL